MKKLVLLLTVTGLFTCNLANAQSVSSPADTATINFLTQANIDGLKNVRSGNVAEKRAKNKKLKVLGAEIVNTDTKAHKELMRLIREKGYQFQRPSLIETAPDTLLIEKRGIDFDKAYVAVMLQENLKTIALLEHVCTNCTDDDVKIFAQKTLKTIQQHLILVQDFAAQFNQPSKNSLVASN